MRRVDGAAWCSTHCVAKIFQQPLAPHLRPRNQSDGSNGAGQLLREVQTIARLTLRKAVEQIAGEMDGPRALADIAQEAAQRSGRPYTAYTKKSVADALARLPSIIRCAPGTYAPVRVALDGKAFRVPLTPTEIESGELSKRRLEPFFTGLSKPPVQSTDGTELATVYLTEERADTLKASAVKSAAQALREMPWLERILQWTDPEEILEKSWEKLNVSQLDSGFIDLAPLGLGDSGFEAVGAAVPSELIVRWDDRSGILKVTVSASSGDTPGAIAFENGILADFIASKLPRDYTIHLGSLLLEAYARLSEVGRTPGSPAFEVVQRDPRMRVKAGNAARLDELIIARADTLTWQERRSGGVPGDEGDRVAHRLKELRVRIEEHHNSLCEVWERECRRLGLDETDLGGVREAKVVPIRKPTHDELVSEWEGELREQGLSDKVRQRKVRHLKTFANYLDSPNPERPSHLLDVDESELRSFFFWTYIRRFPNSCSDAASFTLDLRDFYRFQERRGRVPDARFAELIHSVRAVIVERLELYEDLTSLASITEDDAFDDLYERLFLG